MKTMYEFQTLGLFEPLDGVISLAGNDNVEIALANLQTGLSFAQPQDKTVIVDDSREPIIALPIVPMDIEDQTGRQFELLTDLLLKLQKLTLPEERVGLFVSGEVNTTVLKTVDSVLKTEFVYSGNASDLLSSLEKMDQASQEHSVEHWVWVSLHAGCSAKSINSLGANVATNKTSECSMPADAAAGLILSRHEQKPVAPVTVILEPNADNPLATPTQALSELFSETANIENSVLIHNLPNTASGSIELYRLEQSILEKRADQSDLPWLSDEPARYNMTSVFGDLDVCALPLQLLFMSRWSGPAPVLGVIANGALRVRWQCA